MADKIRYRSILDDPCFADHKAGPTVQMRGIQEHRPKCPECDDRDWIVVSKVREALGGTVDMMPCRLCNPVQHQRWVNGCLAGDNAQCHCDACVGGRAGTIGMSDYAPDGTLLVGFG